MKLGSNRTAIRAISAVLGAGIIAVASAGMSQAHTDLISSNPAAGATIQSDQIPESLSLTFSEPPLLEGSAIVLANEDGSPVTTAPAALEGATLSIPWPTDIKPGTVTVTWRIAADDGHVLTDEFTFTFAQLVDTVGDATPTAVPTVIAPAPTSDDATDSRDAGLTVLWALSTFFVTVGIGMWIRKRKNQ